MMSFFNRRKINRRVYERPTLYRMKRSVLDWLKLSGFSFLLTAALVGSYQFFGRSDFFRLKEVEFVGDPDQGDAERLIRLARIPEGKSLFLINLFEIARNLKRDTEIKDIHLRRRFPDTLTIEVARYQAVALLEVEGSGSAVGAERYLVSRDGVLFKKVPGTESQFLPVIHGFQKGRLIRFADFYRPKIFEAVEALTLFGKEAISRGLTVSSLDYDVTGGMTFTLSDKRDKKKECRIFLGRGDPEAKRAAWTDFFNEMQRKETWYTSVDLHVPGRIFARSEIQSSKGRIQK